MNGFWTVFLIVSGVVFWVLVTAAGLLTLAALAVSKHSSSAESHKGGAR